MDLKIQEIAFHRNGVCGAGFYAVRFRWTPDDSGVEESFLGIVFDGPGECAIIGLDRIASQGVEFAGGNSWRGDRFEDDLREAIKQKWRGSGGTRVGPFCVPTGRRVVSDK